LQENCNFTKSRQILINANSKSSKPKENKILNQISIPHSDHIYEKKYLPQLSKNCNKQNSDKNNKYQLFQTNYSPGNKQDI